MKYNVGDEIQISGEFKITEVDSRDQEYRCEFEGGVAGWLDAEILGHLNPKSICRRPGWYAVRYTERGDTVIDWGGPRYEGDKEVRTQLYWDGEGWRNLGVNIEDIEILSGWLGDDK